MQPTRPLRSVSIAAVLAAGCHLLPAEEPLTVTAVTPETHTEFPIASGAHSGADCNACHGDFDTFSRFDCLSCHEHNQADTTTRHASVANFAWESRRCFECHPDGLALSVDHAKTFPIGTGTKHVTARCADCHVDPARRKTIDCLACHPQAEAIPQHGSVGGYSWQTPLCLRCHGDSQVNPVSTHTPFLVLSASKHFREPCLECHPNARADKPFAEDFVIFECGACHSKSKMDSTHQGRSGYAYLSTTCVTSGCHPDGRKP